MQERKKKISIKKLLIAVLSLAMVVGFVILFVAASQDKQEETCKGIVLSIEANNAQNIYVDTAEIRQFILDSNALNPIGKSLDQLSSPLLKKKVEEQDWVQRANIYLGKNSLLNIKIIQSVPVARIFKRNGRSFYLTKSGRRIKSITPFGLPLPVFTGFPEDGKKQKDSLLLCRIKKICKFIAGNDFWEAQIEQMNINASDEFEMIPRVGDALILLGDGKYFKKKFEKLMTFYQKGLNSIGWGYYDTLDLRFEGQVVAVRKKGAKNPVVKEIVRRNDSESIKNLTVLSNTTDMNEQKKEIN